MKYEQLTIGPLDVNCYILWDEDSNEAMIIDAGAEPERILSAVKRLGLTVQMIVSTHGHVDHVGANAPVMDALGCKFMLHQDDVFMLNDSFGAQIASLIGALPSPPPDKTMKDGDVLSLGKTTMEVIHTPGHSPGSVCLLCEGTLFTGDTLFAGAVGRTDLPGGFHSQLIESIDKRLLTLPDETIVLPGHAYGGLRSSIGNERANNPFLT
ncbi:MBL fold metallo-hydrolase [bacterium]|nr:MBL fold metallo-hydrolase [bacterium]